MRKLRQRDREPQCEISTGSVDTIWGSPGIELCLSKTLYASRSLCLLAGELVIELLKLLCVRALV